MQFPSYGLDQCLVYLYSAATLHAIERAPASILRRIIVPRCNPSTVRRVCDTGLVWIVVVNIERNEIVLALF